MEKHTFEERVFEFFSSARNTKDRSAMDTRPFMHPRIYARVHTRWMFAARARTPRMHGIDAHDGANSSMECRRSGAQLASLIHTYPSSSSSSRSPSRRASRPSRNPAIDLLVFGPDRGPLRRSRGLRGGAPRYHSFTIAITIPGTIKIAEGYGTVKS